MIAEMQIGFIRGLYDGKGSKVIFELLFSGVFHKKCYFICTAFMPGPVLS